MSNSLFKAIPNTLSAIRIALGMAFPWLPADWRLPALAGAIVTDLLDGEASRLFKAESTAGQILDPVADKIFILAVVATLFAEGTITWWQVVLVGARDIAVVGACAVLIVGRAWTSIRRMRARWPGKFATAFQLSFLLAVFLDQPTLVIHATVLLSAITGLVAAVDYFCCYERSRSPV
jgi:phosphatidylglycerophosphate synthase